MKQESKLSEALKSISEIGGENFAKSLQEKETPQTIISLLTLKEGNLERLIGFLKVGRAKSIKEGRKLIHIQNSLKGKDLKDYQVEMAKSYAVNLDSKQSYIESHSHIIKVYASRVLSCIDWWDHVFSEWRRLQPENKWIENILSQYSIFKERYSISPIQAYKDHVLEPKLFIHPTNEINLLTDLFLFFQLLNRSLFMREAQIILQFHFERLHALTQNPITGPTWKPELRKLHASAKTVVDEFIHVKGAKSIIEAA